MKRALLYLIPFAWLGPYLDWTEGSILGYALFLFGLGVLSYSLARSGNLNTLSSATWFRLRFLTESRSA